MTVLAAVPEPEWVLSQQSPELHKRARLQFCLQLAALYHNESGSIGELSKAIGRSETALHMSVKRGNVTGEIAVAIEELLGRQRFPRELFRPDLFTLPQE